MAEDKKSATESVLSFVSSHWGEMLTIGHLVSGMRRGRVPDDAPEAAKAAARAAGVPIGGKGDPTDEAAYKRVLAKIGSSPTEQTSLRTYLATWVGLAFQLHDPRDWVRERGQVAFEEWRVIITKMTIRGNVVDDAVAVEYLTALAKDIRKTFRKHAAGLGTPVSELTSRQAEQCWFLTTNEINQRMIEEGTPVPMGEVAPLATQTKEVLKKVIPLTGGVIAWAKTKASTDGKDLLHRLRAEGEAKALTSWQKAKEATSQADTWMENHAEHRKNLDTSRPWYIRVVDWFL